MAVRVRVVRLVQPAAVRQVGHGACAMWRAGDVHPPLTDQAALKRARNGPSLFLGCLRQWPVPRPHRANTEALHLRGIGSP